MPNAADVLRAKNLSETYYVVPDTSVYEAIRLMSDKGMGALREKVQDDMLVGMFSERDYTRKIALMDRSSRTTPVSDNSPPR